MKQRTLLAWSLVQLILCLFISSVISARAEPTPPTDPGPIQSKDSDTLRMKNGSILHGLVVRFENGFFTVVIPGTQSRAMVHMNDVERIEFVGSETRMSQLTGERMTGPTEGRQVSQPPVTQERQQQPAPATGQGTPPVGPAEVNQGARDVQGGSVSQPEAPGAAGRPSGAESTTPPGTARENSALQGAADTGPEIREVTFRVPAREVWADSGLDVTRGDRLRFLASGQVNLSRNQVSGPGGVSLSDPQKMLPTRPTGALIAVIGDDNDDFIYIGTAAEFTARRSGRLFMMVNENNLDDNTGNFIVRIQLQPSSGQ